jgi:glycosyltransferase involved in cell wall biosynthesis
MRVLVVHNRYSSRVPSGENLAVDDEVRWLVEAGVDVHRHEVSNDDLVDPGPLARLRSGADGIWSLPARRRLLAALDEVRPDVVHVHNLFPLLTGSVPAAARRRGVPVVWTVHNRRTRCVGGGWFRDGQACHDCRPGWRVPGVVHGCYAGSRVASGVVTAGSSLFRTSTRRHDGVTAIAISETMARWVRSSTGIGRSRVRTKFNGVAGPCDAPPPAAEQRAFVFLGRLSAYKGVHLLLDAWRRADVDAELHIVGDGDLAGDVEAAAAADPRIRWVGQVDASDIGPHLGGARAVVVPAVWVEPYGRTAAEALAYGRPVITTGTGGLAEIVDDASGWITGPSAEAMAGALREAATSDEAVTGRGRHAAARHAARFSPEATTAALIRIYEDVAAHGRAPTVEA